jgi:N-acetylmuramoyl-L-alanine amidase
MNKKLTCLVLVIILLTTVFAALGQASTLGSRILKYGSWGRDVAELQTRLNNLGFYVGEVDGIYGLKTERGVIRFQQSRGLRIDGIAGPQTIRALLGNTSVSRGYSSRDVELLAKLIYAEARGESYIGQVAVGATVLNRVKSPAYPNTIPGVIFQVVDGYYQYCSVRDGQIYLTPNATARKAARDALAGWDPTGGALTFYNPRNTTNIWVRSRPYCTTIGNHVFVK